MGEKKVDKIARNDRGLQEQFINQIKQSLPPGIGIAEEMADILGVSTDSAYRRIRGETELTLTEVAKLSKRLSINLDDAIHSGGNMVSFNYTMLTNSADNFKVYITRLTEHMANINKFDNKKIYYVAEEMPLFYSFYSQKFADFKLYYWQRSILNCPEYQQTHYSPGLIPAEVVNIAQQCFREYMTIPSVEIWTDLTVLTGLRQITFYYDSGIITKPLTLELLDEYKRTIGYIQKLAERGRKNESDKDETFVLYNSEIVLGTNCIYTTMGERSHSYISFNTLNSLTTNNSDFCQEMEHWMSNLERKSNRISGVSEKQRYQFFSSMYRKIDECIETVNNS